jgi:hypothetical protein
VPAATLLLVGLLLLCPLMMFVMMRGMHGGADVSGHDSDSHHTSPKDTPHTIEQHPNKFHGFHGAGRR